MKKLHVYILLFVVMIFLAMPLSAAKKEVANESFDLIFRKPPKNEFFFSDPLQPSLIYGSESARGIVFSDVDTDKLSTAAVGITYKLESLGTLSVFCNSEVDLTGSHMMASGSAGVDFSIKVSDIDLSGAVTKEGKFTAYAATDAVFTRIVQEPMTTNEYKKIDMNIDANGIVQGQYTGYIIMQFTTT